VLFGWSIQSFHKTEVKRILIDGKGLEIISILQGWGGFQMFLLGSFQEKNIDFRISDFSEK